MKPALYHIIPINRMACLFKASHILLIGGVLLSGFAYSQEICDNAIDDDGDGLVDLNDEDCTCWETTIPSLIPNHSFEDHSCCPGFVSQLHCADHWVQASIPTSDYYNFCDFSASPFQVDPPLPLPDGEAWAGFYNFHNWQEMIGSCLISPMIPGVEYNISFFLARGGPSPPLDMAIYGSPNCSDLPFDSKICPVGLGEWRQMGMTHVPGLLSNDGWQNFSITFTPTDTINVIVLGGSCDEPSGGLNYYFIDNLVLDVAEEVEILHLNEAGSWCADDLVLVASKDIVNGTYQWYKDSIALVGETSDTLKISDNGYGAGEYSVVLEVPGENCEIQSVVVVEPSVPIASGSINGGCATAHLDFIDESTIGSGSITGWEWNFGDQEMSNEQNPTHQYNEAGIYDVILTVESDSGCTDTLVAEIEIYPKPEASFSYEICFNASTSFTDETTLDMPNGIVSWHWSFEGGSTSSLSNPSFSYPSAGNYEVELIVETNDGCRDTVQEAVSIREKPIADFIADTVCLGNITSFQNTSTIGSGTIISYAWEFNPGNSSLSNPQYTFGVSGSHNVLLTIESGEGCTDSVYKTVMVNPSPQANFEPVEACFGYPTDFEEVSWLGSGTIAQTFWDFGDSFSSTQTNPSHLYTLAGDYEVYLEVTSDQGCVSDTSKTVSVYAIPQADFNADDECLGVPVHITENSTITTGNINYWEWDFGDQNTFIGQNPPDHVYTNDGVYGVTLVVSSGFSCRDTTIKYLDIYPAPVADFGYGNICVGDTSFYIDMTTTGGSDIDTWQWSLGNNIESYLQNPSIVYQTAGIYDVKLLVVTEDGCIDDISHQVTVFPLPDVDFEYTDACQGDTVGFADLSIISSGTLIGWAWDFGDNNLSTIQNPYHAYQSAGQYSVTVTVTSDSLCVNEASKSIQVFPLPVADFNTSPTEGCPPLEVDFTDVSSISSGTITQWYWDLGNALSSSQYPTNIYNDSGFYSVSLIVISSDGCADTVSIQDMVRVFPSPYASFSASPQTTTITYPSIGFSDESSLDVTSWLWNLGDGTISTDENPQHDYQDTGTYAIVQIVENQYNCLDTAIDTIRVDGAFTFYIPNSFTPNGNRLNDGFSGKGMGIVKYTMRIFNRWGEEVFFSTDPTEQWDGTIRSETKLVQNEVFVYRVELEDILGKVHVYNGHVTLIR